ncbi:hypothetical protein INT08_04640 [Prosthecochloris sp. N3]|uniref:Uncharacterized protein n=1 Tax=Prosthecochloris ethylica TaxID=2743976 RepID=A0ABR9XR07_9CHLB|nr:hypothetical protein [Prosthecochloris ethylica]MBF0586316.1 hypothetical protein [Prosthecochloris ethylica]MBF0636466.1 hypothetical protein [Prosthecochloris ethylica]MEC9486965.1 hypothetical protein [Prosthecochloris sp.]NUK47640.1 hypothetical protein [Prosthecochloris ethylica]
MRQTLFQEKYPVYTLEVDKSETSFTSVDAIVDYFKEKIDAHPVVAFIGIFDHYKHTSSLKDGVISDDIKDAKNILFCFGKELPSPLVLSVRPRSIGVVELANSFVITFLEAPNPAANEAMESWALGVKNR